MTECTVGRQRLIYGDWREADLPGPYEAIVTDPPAEAEPGLLERFLQMCSGPVLWFGCSSTMARMLKGFPQDPERIMAWKPWDERATASAKGIAYTWAPIYCWRLPGANDGVQRDAFTRGTDPLDEWRHPARKPLLLVQGLLGLVAPGGHVLDPYVGSGTTLVACERTGRSGTGVEVNARHWVTACKRLRAAE